MSRLWKITAALSACMLLVVPLALAQAPCRMDTLTGTYAMYEKGAAYAINLAPQPAPPTWTATAIAPFANLGQLTFTGDSIGTGFYWIWAGSYRPGLDAVPFTANVLSLDADCTGEIEYTTTVPGASLPVTIHERFLVTDNGREFHTVPMSIVNGVPTQAWIGRGIRMSKSPEPITSCGQQTATGKYLMRCENIVRSLINPALAVADTFLMRFDVSVSGDYEGKLFEKMGPTSIDGHPVWGTITVTPNCSYTATFNADGVAGTVIQKGLFFDEGKKAYGTAILNDSKPADQQGMKYSFCETQRIGE